MHTANGRHRGRSSAWNDPSSSTYFKYGHHRWMFFFLRRVWFVYGIMKIQTWMMTGIVIAYGLALLENNRQMDQIRLDQWCDHCDRDHDDDDGVYQQKKKPVHCPYNGRYIIGKQTAYAWMIASHHHQFIWICFIRKRLGAFWHHIFILFIYASS